MKIALAPVKLKNKDIEFNMSQIKHYMQQAKENNCDFDLLRGKLSTGLSLPYVEL
ncbi:MAG: hypothetical protein LIO74_00095 [Ruminococcus sp.]|nr:hypothetical protein [Ruminococcus sp.]